MPRNAPFVLPTWPPRWPEIVSAVQECIDSGEWGRYHSRVCRDLAMRLAERAGGATVQLCCSGTAAIEIALRAARVKAGDEVVVAAIDYPGNIRCVEAVGATPVLVDTCRQSPVIDTNSLLRLASDTAASGKVVAVIASQLYGHAADMIELQNICQHQGWVLINDACQAMGMLHDGKPIETFGDLATLSFGGSKVVTAGAGGSIVTADDRLASRLSVLMNRPSEVFAISPLQAAVIGPQLDRLDEMTQRRNDCVRLFCENSHRLETVGLKIKTPLDERVLPSFYKLAMETSSEIWRAEFLGLAESKEIPFGEPFRCMANTSQRRCRKPMPLDNATAIGATWTVLDQRALLVEPDQRSKLLELIVDLAGSVPNSKE